MSQPFALRSRSRLLVLFSTVSTLAACGGGGGGEGDAGTPPPAPPAGPLTYADCTQLPSGVTNTYLNSSRPKREWKAAMFLGQAVTARYEYLSAAATTPVRAWYYQVDAGANTVTTVGHEDFDGSGNLTRREQFTGWVHSTTLAAGQSETVNYTVTTLVPAGQADVTQRSTLTYETNEVITLPGGRLDTCRVKEVTERTSGTPVQLSVETAHLARGLGLVKSYYKPTWADYTDRNQTYLTEIVSTTGSLALAAAPADTAPTLAQCSALPANQSLEISASTVSEANSAFRVTSSSTFNGAAVIAVERRNAASNARSQIDFYDPSVGQLLYRGVNAYGSTGTALVNSVVRTGRPDLRGTAPLATVPYAETFQVVVPAGGATSTTNDSFTFEGYAKVTTPAGTFDTCKVRFNYEGGLVETYYLAPNRYWVRLETMQAGVRTTRELIAH